MLGVFNQFGVLPNRYIKVTQPVTLTKAINAFFVFIGSYSSIWESLFSESLAYLSFEPLFICGREDNPVCGVSDIRLLSQVRIRYNLRFL